MELDDLLSGSEQAIIDEAVAALARAHAAHYQTAGESFTRERLTHLFALVVAAIRERDVTEVVAHSERIAEERFASGFGISEVQTAYNVLEEAMWRAVVVGQPPDRLAESIGLLGTALGAGKDAMARTYVSLASSRHVPSLDLSALFTGIQA